MKNNLQNPTLEAPTQEEDFNMEVVLSVKLPKNEEDRKKKRAKIEALVSGWNLNGYFIPSEVLPMIKELVLAKPKLFINHDLYAYLGRNVQEWAATYESINVSPDGTKLEGDIVFTSNPNTSWIYDEIERNASDVEFSMHFKAITEEYNDPTINRSGEKVLGIAAYRSTDIVAYGAAGGKAVQIYNSVLEKRIMNIEDRILNKNPNQNKKENEMPEIKSIQDLRAQYPQLVTEMLNAEIESLNIQNKVKDSETKITDLTNSVNAISAEKTNLEAKVTELTNSVNTLTAENTELKLKVDGYTALEKVNAWKTSVETELTNSQIDSKLITPEFSELLFAMNDIELVKKAISDRKNLVAGSIVNVGAPPPPQGEQEVKLSEEEIINGFITT
jgi:hypothetical protein